MGRSFFDLLRREDGVVAVIFAVMAIPFIAMAGWAVDYLRLEHVKEYLQTQVDSAALNATYKEDLEAPDGTWEAAQWEIVRVAIEAEIARTYQGDWASGVTLTHEWVTPGAVVSVTASANVPLAFMNILPAVPDTQLVQVSALARVNDVYPDYKIEIADLDYDAGDYNRVWAYCYWPNRPANDPDLPNRTQMVPIADNGGPDKNRRNKYENEGGNPFLSQEEEKVQDSILAQELAEVNHDYALGLNGRERGLWRQTAGGDSNWREYLYVAPVCTGDSFLSFRLENVRFSRTQHRFWEDEYNEDMNWDGHSRWDFAPSGYGHKARFNYYTDTFENDSRPDEQYADLTLPDVNNQYVEAGAPANVLETILCDTQEQCTTTNEGGIIPYRKSNRDPLRASQACEEGKYMYYGWEDRPPGLDGPDDDWNDIAWTDSDYDDIRVVIQCPVTRLIGDRNARLVG